MTMWVLTCYGVKSGSTQTKKCQLIMYCTMADRLGR